MDYVELIENDARPTAIQQYLTDGDATAVTVRIPRNLRDAAREAASMRGMGFSAFVRACLIDELLHAAKD